jgi:hypothetical protein
MATEDTERTEIENELDRHIPAYLRVLCVLCG